MYYETCATYGLNVERVFQEACQKLATNIGNAILKLESDSNTNKISKMQGVDILQKELNFVEGIFGVLQDRISSISRKIRKYYDFKEKREEF